MYDLDLKQKKGDMNQLKLKLNQKRNVSSKKCISFFRKAFSGSLKGIALEFSMPSGFLSKKTYLSIQPAPVWICIWVVGEKHM